MIGGNNYSKKVKNILYDNLLFISQKPELII